MNRPQLSLPVILPKLLKIQEQKNYQLLLSESEGYLFYVPDSAEILAFKYRALCGLGMELNNIGFLRKYCWYSGIDEDAFYSLHLAYVKQNDPFNALVSLVYSLSINESFAQAEQAINSILDHLGYSRLKIYFLTSDRIGHLSTEVDSWIRQNSLESEQFKTLHLFMNNVKPANDYFFSLLKEYINIVEEPFWSKIYSSRPHLMLEKYYGQMPLDLKSCRRVPNTVSEERVHKKLQEIQLKCPAVIQLNEQEIELGWELLSKKGISNTDKIICFHVRDSAYLLKRDNPINDVYHDVRDMDINTYDKSVKHLLSMGYVVIRLGCETNQYLSITNSKYIDLCLDRDVAYGDFLDVFLLSQCQFFIGNTSGVAGLANCFDTPILALNMTPFGIWHPAYSRYIPKYYVNNDEVVTFYEMLNDFNLKVPGGAYQEGKSCFYPTQILVDNGYSFYDNDEDEIYESVIEFEAQVKNRKLEEKFTPLQQKYIDSIPENLLMKYSTSVLTDCFLRKNIDSFNLTGDE